MDPFSCLLKSLCSLPPTFLLPYWSLYQACSWSNEFVRIYKADLMMEKISLYTIIVLFYGIWFLSFHYLIKFNLGWNWFTEFLIVFSSENGQMYTVGTRTIKEAPPALCRRKSQAISICFCHVILDVAWHWLCYTIWRVLI